MNLAEMLKEADLAFENNNFADAFDLFYQAYQISPEEGEISHSIGLCYFHSDDIASALKWLNHAISLNPKHAGVRNSIGNALIYSRDIDGAFDHLVLAVELDGNLAHAHQNLAECYRHKGDFERAVYHAKLALSLDSNLVIANKILCIACYSLGDYTASIDHGERHLTDFGEDGMVLSSLANSYQLMKRYDKAVAYHKMVLSINDGAKAYHSISRYSLSLINLTFGKLDQAIFEFKQYIDEFPNEALYYVGLADAYSKKEDHQAVIETIDQAIRIGGYPDLAELLLKKAEALFAVKKSGDAALVLQEVLKLDPTNFEILKKLGALFYNKLQNVDKAIDFYSKSLAIAPDEIDTHEALGELYRMEGLHQLAISCYEKMLELDASSLAAHDGLAECYRHSKRYDEAGRVAKYILTIEPNNSSALFCLGECYLHLNEFEQARVNFEKCYSLSKDWIMSYVGLGILHRTIARQFEEPSHFLAIQHFMLAKKYFQQGLQINEHFNFLHLELSALPEVCFQKSELNPLGHFLRAIFLAEINRYNSNFISQNARMILERTIGFDMPLLAFVVLGNAGEDASGQHYFHRALEHLNRLTEPFRTLFYLTHGEALSKNQISLIGVLMYHLGDPINTYRFYRDKDSGDLSILDHYYYAISAKAILETKHAKFLTNFSVPFAFSFIRKIRLTLSEAYYAAEVLSLADHEKDAETLRKQLENYGFLPNLIKREDLGEIGLDLSQGAFDVAKSGDLFKYFKSPGVVNLVWEDADLERIMPLVHLMECSAYFPEIDGSFFTKYVSLDFLQNENRENFIKKNFPHKHALIFGSPEDKVWTERKLNALLANKYSLEEELLADIGYEILTSANQQLTDIKGNVKDFLRVNYKNYILLANLLQERDKLSFRNKHIIQHYTIYCATCVEAFVPETIPGNPIKDEIMSIADILTSYFIYFPISKILSIKEFLSGVYFRRVGKQREILSIADFIAQRWQEDLVK